MTLLTPSRSGNLLLADRSSAIVTASGAQAETRFWEFFTVTIRNQNTRVAYARAAAEFCAFVRADGIGDLRQVQPIHVAAYVEALGKTHAPSTVKLRLAAIRMLFDWLVTGQIIPFNPAMSRFTALHGEVAHCSFCCMGSPISGTPGASRFLRWRSIFRWWRSTCVGSI